MAAGALAANGARWIDAAPRVLLPVRASSTVCRGKFGAALAHACSTGAVPLAEGPTALSTAEDGAQLRAQLYTTEWVVYATAPLAGPAPVLDSVGRDTHRVAIANHRLLDVRDGWVRFSSRNRRQGHRGQTMTRDADACIRRFLLQVLPHGFMRLRHMGSSPTGTRLVPCAVVGNCWASPPSHPHAAHSVWSRGCQRSRGSTSRTVRPVAPGHWSVSRCPLSLHALAAAGRLGRCRSTTRHEPSVASQVAAGDTITAPPEPSGGRACLRGSEVPNMWDMCATSPCRGAPRGSCYRSLASASPAAPRLWLLSHSAPRATIPIRMSWRDGVAAQYHHVLSAMLAHGG